VYIVLYGDRYIFSIKYYLLYIKIGINLFYWVLSVIYIYILIFNLGKHPFLNKKGMVNHKKQVIGEYDKVKEGRYSSALIYLMERMMHVV
jgi:hypothetical protein